MTDNKEIKSIINLDRDYKYQPLMFGSERGVYDSIHQNEEIANIHKIAVSYFWQADEFNFAPCKAEFLEENDGKDLMIETLSWQWVADSCATSLAELLMPFISDDGLAQLILYNTYLETVHSESYSEIVKNSFVDPEQTIKNVEKNEEVISRLSKVIEVFSQLREVGLKYSQGTITKEEAYPVVYKGVVVLYLMERLQFIASFAITFALGEMGRFQPICTAIKKIATDEAVVHADTDLAILKDMRKDPQWFYVNTEKFQEELASIVDEVANREKEWTEYLFRDRTLPGINKDLIKDWVDFNADICRKSLGLPVEGLVKTNPIPFIKQWLNLDATQVAPQEQELAQYMVGSINNDLDNLDMDLDF